MCSISVVLLCDLSDFTIVHINLLDSQLNFLRLNKLCIKKITDKLFCFFLWYFHLFNEKYV